MNLPCDLRHRVSRTLALKMESCRSRHRSMEQQPRNLGRAYEDVAFPFGKLVRVRRHFNKYWDSIDDWPADRQGQTVDWALDMAEARLLYPEAWAGAPKQGRRSRQRRTG